MNTDIKIEKADMGKGRSHCYIGTTFKKAGVELNIDLSGADAGVEFIAKALVVFLESLADTGDAAVANKAPKRASKKVPEVKAQ